ncbi:MAG: hypothetical protein P8J32_05085 [bacterium]|nr:hypothetical protein [bacterium]
MRFDIVKVIISAGVHSYDLLVGGNPVDRFDTLREARAAERMYATMLADHRSPVAA